MTDPIESAEPAETTSVTRRAIAQYLASMHDGKPIRVRQRYATAALLDVAEYIAIVSGARTEADRLQYVHAISLMQDEGSIIVEEVADGGPGNSLAALVYSYVTVTLSPEAAAEARSAQ